MGLVLKDWHYPMPRLWFVKNKGSAYFSEPPRIRLHYNADIETVLHELQHYRDDRDHLSIGIGDSPVYSLSDYQKTAEDEALTDMIAKQLRHQYASLWKQIVGN